MSGIIPDWFNFLGIKLTVPLNCLTSQVFYLNVEVMPKYNQKGAIPLLIPLVIGIVVISGIYLISKKPNNTPATRTTSQNSPISTSAPTPAVQWETYKDEKYGYLLKHPKGWTVENLPSGNNRLIKVTAANKTGFVLIEGIAGPSLEKTGELEKVMNFLEDKLKKNTNLKIANLTRSNEDDMSGYLATGEETFDGKTVEFEEKFIVWKSGRGIRMHAAFSLDSKEINKPILSEIMTSFKTD